MKNESIKLFFNIKIKYGRITKIWTREGLSNYDKNSEKLKGK